MGVGQAQAFGIRALCVFASKTLLFLAQEVAPGANVVEINGGRSWSPKHVQFGPPVLPSSCDSSMLLIQGVRAPAKCVPTSWPTKFE